MLASFAHFTKGFRCKFFRRRVSWRIGRATTGCSTNPRPSRLHPPASPQPLPCQACGKDNPCAAGNPWQAAVWKDDSFVSPLPSGIDRLGYHHSRQTNKNRENIMKHDPVTTAGRGLISACASTIATALLLISIGAVTAAEPLFSQKGSDPSFRGLSGRQTGRRGSLCKACRCHLVPLGHVPRQR